MEILGQIDYEVLGPFAALVALGIVIATAGKIFADWLDKRAKAQAAELQGEITRLEERVKKLENGHADARMYLYSCLHQDMSPEVRGSIMKALEVLR